MRSGGGGYGARDRSMGVGSHLVSELGEVVYGLFPAHEV